MSPCADAERALMDAWWRRKWSAAVQDDLVRIIAENECLARTSRKRLEEARALLRRLRGVEIENWQTPFDRGQAFRRDCPGS